MSEEGKISELMKSDWNRRVSHDYRFWMSDGYKTDAEMWETGARDLAIITNGIADQENKSILEIGCGVGRILKTAVTKFKRVIGVDVADAAIAKARELIGPVPNIELVATNGVDLGFIKDGTLDVVMSFAAITSMPTEVIARYLREIHRVVKSDGVVRLQMYLGTPQQVAKDNTLHLRCFERENFSNAMAAAGFKIHSISELVLPFQVSSKEWGIEAVVVSMERVEKAPADVLTIARLLLPEGEPPEEKDSADEGISTVDLEYWMTLNHAKDLIDQGDYIRARAALNYALKQCSGNSVDAKNLVEEIVRALDAAQTPTDLSTMDFSLATPAASAATAPVQSQFFANNLAVIAERFPKYLSLLKTMPDWTPGVEVSETQDGPVLSFEGQAMDHPAKPKSAGEQWTKRLLNEERAKKASRLVIFGFSAGYHIEALLKETKKEVAVIEPSAELFWRAMNVRDLTQILRSIKALSIGKEDRIDFFDEGSELIVRAQTQVVAGEYCAALRSMSYGKRGLAALRPNIAVLGPLQGGTLPIAAYVARSLTEMNQRVRPWDVSGFAGGYHIVEDFLKDKGRRTVSQSNYVEFVSQMLLEAATETKIDILICMAQAPISGRVLAELRKRGTITVLWFVEDYHRFSYWKDMAKYYDFVFTIQKGECIEAIRQAGAGEVHYLPTGCDPEVHKPMNLSDEDKARWGSPISFVGAGYHNRQQVFASFAELPFKIWGTEWPECRPFDRLVQEGGRRLTPAEYTKIFNSTDININLHSSGERDGVDPFGDFVNPRTVELAASGAFQLVDERALLPEMFNSDEVVTFKTPADLKEKIAYYLAHPEERKSYVEKARARALRDHSYTARMREMLSIIYSSKFETLKRREEENPWHKLLARAERHPELYERCKRAFERGEEPNLDGLVADIVSGKGSLTDTEQKLLFLFHIRRQIIRMRAEEAGDKK